MDIAVMIMIMMNRVIYHQEQVSILSGSCALTYEQYFPEGVFISIKEELKLVCKSKKYKTSVRKQIFKRPKICIHKRKNLILD